MLIDYRYMNIKCVDFLRTNISYKDGLGWLLWRKNFVLSNM